MKNRISLALILTLTFVVLLVGVAQVASARVEIKGDYLAFTPPVPADDYTYLPLVYGESAPAGDVYPTHIELNQSSQTDSNTVTLIESKKTFARVYVATDSPADSKGITVKITARRGGVGLGFVTIGPQDVLATYSREQKFSSFNVQLPDAWTMGTVNLFATADSADVMKETNEGNNLLMQTFVFNKVPALQVVIVPIKYTHTGPTRPGLYQDGAPTSFINDWADRAFPMPDVVITRRDGYYNFTGNLENQAEWSPLLDAMYDLKINDGYPPDTPVVYYGLIPTENAGGTWFYSGVAGLGWVSTGTNVWREAIGLNLGANDDTSTIMAHEIGHNLGRRHSPCGNPSGVDPLYPYANADIGQIGVEIMPGTVDLKLPGDYSDLMAYCWPQWVSDYTYEGLRADQVAKGGPVLRLPEESLSIKVNLDSQDNPTFDKVTALSAVTSPAPANSEYALQLLDGVGKVIATYPAAVREAEDYGIHIRAIYAVVPMPDTKVASVRLLRGESVLGETSVGD